MCSRTTVKHIHHSKVEVFFHITIDELSQVEKKKKNKKQKQKQPRIEIDNKNQLTNNEDDFN